MSLISIQEPQATPVADMPLLRLGFRPFYLLAAIFGALAVPLWTFQYLGWTAGWSTLWPRVGLGWHMHEMVFGMAVAVVIGFLYTAGRNWTGLWTPRNGQLAALALLWLAGRVAMLLAPPWPAAVIDLLFLPLAAWPMYQVLRQAGNKRNLFLVGLLGALTLANFLYHATVLGCPALALSTPIHAAILIIVVIESVIGGRVIPMFTTNGAPGSKPVVHPVRDRIALGLTVGASVAWVAGAPAVLQAVLAGAAGVALMVRVLGWQPQRTLRVPLLWILHLSYGWIAIGFLLLALAALKVLAPSAAMHALTVGSMAGLIIGMMTRTSLGHTGRPLTAGRAEVAMYVLIQAGAVLRVLVAVGMPQWRTAGLAAAALCWSAAFLLFALKYAPYLARARIDGREG
ncbi:MAG: NnrS family protein [Pseudomonadota bacterium]